MPEDTTIRKGDREQKEKMKRCADKRHDVDKSGRHSFMKGRKEEQPVGPIRPGSDGCRWHRGRFMIDANNNQKIRTRNYAD